MPAELLQSRREQQLRRPGQCRMHHTKSASARTLTSLNDRVKRATATAAAPKAAFIAEAGTETKRAVFVAERAEFQRPGDAKDQVDPETIRLKRKDEPDQSAGQSAL
jgi:hypothetical protein